MYPGHNSPIGRAVDKKCLERHIPPAAFSVGLHPLRGLRPSLQAHGFSQQKVSPPSKVPPWEGAPRSDGKRKASLAGRVGSGDHAARLLSQGPAPAACTMRFGRFSLVKMNKKHIEGKEAGGKAGLERVRLQT